MTLIVLGLTEGMIEEERSDSVVECWTRSRVAGLNLSRDTVFCWSKHLQLYLKERLKMSVVVECST